MSASKPAEKLRRQDARLKQNREDMRAAAERGGKDLTGFNDFYLKAKDRGWHWLSYVCHIRSTAI